MSPDPKSLKYLQNTLNVSRETLAALESYVAVTVEWQKAINLISPSTVPDIWWRHIVDSAQLYPLIPTETQTVLDIGSGGGFPAIVLAILTDDQIDFTLVESDRRKGIFLREAARVAGLTRLKVVTARIEKLPSQTFDLVTARALAPVDQLLEWAKPYGRSFLFPKGENVEQEVALISQDQYKIEYFQSVTDDKAKVVRIESL